MKDFIALFLKFFFQRTYSPFEVVAYFIVLSIAKALLAIGAGLLAVIAAVLLFIITILVSMYCQRKFTNDSDYF